MTGRTPVPEEFRDKPPGPTPAQLNYLMSLLQERNLSAGGDRRWEGIYPGTDAYERAVDEQIAKAKTLSVAEASRWIGRLRELPRLSERGKNLTARSDMPNAEELPAGRYAIDNEGGELRFYKLWRGDRNPDYIKLYLQHGPDESEVPFRTAVAIMKKIMEAGPASAAVRYGHEIGACSRCGLRLTNRLSRELGIGPICGGHFYQEDEWKVMKSAARDDLRERGLDPNENIEEDEA